MFKTSWKEKNVILYTVNSFPACIIIQKRPLNCPH